MIFLKISEVNASKPLDYQSIIGLHVKLPPGVGGQMESMSITDAWLTETPCICPKCGSSAQAGLIQLQAGISIFHCIEGCHQFVWCELKSDEEV